MEVGSETSQEGIVPGQPEVLNATIAAEARLRAAGPATSAKDIAVDFSPYQHTPAPELKIEFGDENDPEVLRRMEAIGKALESDDNPAVAVRLVLTHDFLNTGPAIREQLKYGASRERPDLAAAIFGDEGGEGKGFWRTPNSLDEVDVDFKDRVVAAANGGQTDELSRLQDYLPMSYRVVIEAIFAKAQKEASESDRFSEALQYLHQIPGLEGTSVGLTRKDGEIKKILTFPQPPTE